MQTIPSPIEWLQNAIVQTPTTSYFRVVRREEVKYGSCIVPTLSLHNPGNPHVKMTGVPCPPGGSTYCPARKHHLVLLHGVAKFDAMMLHAGINAANRHVALHPLGFPQQVVQHNLNSVF